YASVLFPPFEGSPAPLEQRQAAPHGAERRRHVEHRGLHLFLHHLEERIQIGQAGLRRVRRGHDTAAQFARGPNQTVRLGADSRGVAAATGPAESARNAKVQSGTAESCAAATRSTIVVSSGPAPPYKRA